MGTPMAVSAAIIYLARLEEPLLACIYSSSILQEIYRRYLLYLERKSNWAHLVFYRRYIDDIFFIWSGNLTELDSFLHRLNNLASTIKLAWDISKEKAIFLDMVIFKDQDVPSNLVTKPYQKSLNRYLYIPYNSYHPTHSKRSFIKAELIRYVRLSSKLSDVLEIKSRFFNRLWNRGYPKWFLLDVFLEVHFDLHWNYVSEKKKRPVIQVITC